MISLVLNYKKLALVLVCLGILSLSVSMSEAESLPYVSSPSWSPDASKVAVVVNNSVEVRDVPTSQILYTLNGHTGLIPMVAWSPDSSMIATPSYDQTVKLWNAVDGQLLNTLLGHNAAVTSVTWSPDSEQLVSSGFDTKPNLFVWDTKTGNLVSTHNGGAIVAAAFSPDGKRFAIANILSISILDGMTFEVIATSPRISCCANVMYSIAWNSESNMLVTGSTNGLVTLWDASTAQIIRQFQANSHYTLDSRDVDNLALSWVRAVTFGAGSNTILAVSGDGSVREWDNAIGTLIQESQITPVFTAAWSPYGGRLAILEPKTQDATALSNEQSFDTSRLTGVFTIVVPIPSLERLQTIAAVCDAPAAIKQMLTAQTDSLASFVTQIEALPEAALPPSCAADLIAVASALQSQ